MNNSCLSVSLLCIIAILTNAIYAGECLPSPLRPEVPSCMISVINRVDEPVVLIAPNRAGECDFPQRIGIQTNLLPVQVEECFSDWGISSCEHSLAVLGVAQEACIDIHKSNALFVMSARCSYKKNSETPYLYMLSEQQKVSVGVGGRFALIKRLSAYALSRVITVTNKRKDPYALLSTENVLLMPSAPVDVCAGRVVESQAKKSFCVGPDNRVTAVAACMRTKKNGCLAFALDEERMEQYTLCPNADAFILKESGLVKEIAHEESA